MRAKVFTVPFAKVVGEEATELEFGPEDYLVVRPIFGMSAIDIRTTQARIETFEAKPVEAQKIADPKKRKAELDKLNVEAGELILSLMDLAVIDWKLAGEAGPIERPHTVEALDALPGAIRGGLYGFLVNYRGDTDGANPTIRS